MFTFVLIGQRAIFHECRKWSDIASVLLLLIRLLLFTLSYQGIYLRYDGRFYGTSKKRSNSILVLGLKSYSKLLARRWSIVSEDYFTHSQRLTTTFFAFTQGHNICNCSTNGAQNSNAQFFFSMGMFSLVKLQELNSSFTRCRKKRLDLHC